MDDRTGLEWVHDAWSSTSDGYLFLLALRVWYSGNRDYDGNVG